jgi:hypothetical protein
MFSWEEGDTYRRKRAKSVELILQSRGNEIKSHEKKLAIILKLFIKLKPVTTRTRGKASDLTFLRGFLNKQKYRG